MRFTFLGSLAMFLFTAISANAALTQSDGCYLIGSADDLYQLNQIYNSYDEDSLAMRLDCAKLTQDIVVNENVLKADGTPNEGPFRPWESIRSFEGTFDGQNHTISGLYQKSFDHLGLFFYLRGSVKNLGIVDSYFYVPDSTYNSRIGAIAAQVYDTVTIENSYSAATIEVLSGGNGVAGLVGLVGGSAMLTIKDCHNEGVIVSTYERSSSTGGLVGDVALSSTVILFNSYNTGSVSGYGDVGGLMGRVESSSRLDDRSAKFIIEKCYNSGAVYGLTTNVGGLVGAGQGTIKESYNVGYVKAASAVGGLVGSANIDLIGTVNNSDTLRIENSYNRGTVETFLPEGEFDYPIGGFVGSVERVLPFIVNSYNAADIIQNGKVKNGLIGKIEYSELVIEKTVNRKVSDGTPCDGVTDVEDSLFFNGVVATYLHQNNEVWGQKSIGEGMYPDLSGKVNASVSVYPITWHTFEGDTNDYPSTYTLGMGLKLPENFKRKGYIFEGWYAVANPTDKDVKLDKIGTTETGAKTLYARWTRLLDFDGRCYLISDAQELYNFASIVNGTYGGEPENGACGKLTQDIVVNEHVLTTDGKLNEQGTFRKWTPMMKFEGVFDGDGHTIYGLYYDDTEDEDGVGFIGEIYFGERGVKKVEIKNLGLEDFYFRGGYRVGAFAGYAYASTEESSLTITNSHSNGVVEGQENVGGFVGQIEVITEITGSYNRSFVNADVAAGGIIGSVNLETKILDCYNMGSVNAFKEKSGGFVGEINETSVDIIDSYNSGSVSGFSNVGGLVGYIYHYQTLTILRSFNDGEVHGIMDVGGLVGTGYGYPVLVFINSYNKGRVTGSKNVAGILGWMKTVDGSVDVFNSYNAGEIVSVADFGDEVGAVASLVGFGEGGSYSFDNAFYLNQGNLQAFILDSMAEGIFVPNVRDSGFVAVTEEKLMGGSVADSLRGWYEKDGEKPKENGQDGFAWAEDPAGTKILPHLNWDNVKHRVMLVVGEGASIAKDHEVTYYEEGVPVNLPDSQYVSREGYIFAGWYGSSSYSGSPETSVDVCGTDMKVFYAKWELDSTLISSSSEVASSSSEESSSSVELPKSSSSSAKSSSSEKSSSSVASSSSVVKSSSSVKQSSSSVVKSSSSSAPKQSSSSKKSGKSSSSSKTNSIEMVAVPLQFSVTVQGNMLQVAGARVGATYALFDMQGNMVLRGTANSASFNVNVPTSGSYVLRIGNGSRKVSVFK